jgi:hypothetical protein
MFFHTLRIYKDVINEHHDKLGQLQHENIVHEVHEVCGAFVNQKDITRYS